MMRITFHKMFVDGSGRGLKKGKLHTVRINYKFWKKHEGKELALSYWEGKPRRRGSTMKTFAVKRLVFVQKADYKRGKGFFTGGKGEKKKKIDEYKMAVNDGFEKLEDFKKWFMNSGYKGGDVGILHFTDMKY